MFCILLKQTQLQCSHMTCFVSIQLVETSQMRSLTLINTVRCSAYCLNKLSSSGAHTTCFYRYRTSRDLSNEESHLDQYCQMFCILLEQTQFQCSHTTCLVSADPDETSQMRGLTWIRTIRCSAYCLNKFISNFSHDLFGHCRTR